MQEQHVDDSRSVFQKKRWRELIGGNQLAKRMILAFAFLIILTCFLHFREVRMEVFEIGTKAPRYVISQANFVFLDEEATRTIRLEAVRDIGAIVKVEENQVSAVRHGFENSLIEQQQWRNDLPISTFEEVYSSLDRIEEVLLRARFSDDRTLKKMLSLKISLPDFFSIPSTAETESVLLPKSFWKDLKQQLEPDKQAHSETIDYLVTILSRQGWKLQEDFALERSVRQKVQSEIADRYSRVEAGSQIIKTGEKVTPRHIAMLQAMKNTLAQSRNLFAPLTLLGSVLVALSLMITSMFYLYFFYRELFKSLQKMALLVVIIVMGLALAKCAEHLLLYQNTNLMEAARFPLLLPFTALLISVLIGSEIALVSSFFLLIVFGSTLAVDYIPFLLLNFFAALATILFARRLHKRKKVFAVCGKVWLSIIPLFFAFNLVDNRGFDFNFVIELISSLTFLVITAVLTVALLPILESIFNFITNHTQNGKVCR
jgi:membrane-associated HD superfamily phosphohydrolase